MTALAEAFSKLGYKPHPEQRSPESAPRLTREDIRERAKADLPDVTAMSDQELDEAIAQTVATMAAIRVRLAEQPGSQNGWRGRAERALAFEGARKVVLEGERKRRVEAARSARLEEHRRHEAEVTHRKEEAARLNAEKQVLGRKAQRSALFVKAALAVLPAAEYHQLWARARELFPDDPAWN